LSSLKLLALFRTEFEHAAATSCLPPASKVFCIASALRTQLFGDVELLEGVNSLIRINNNRAPNIGLPLLNSRIQLKKALGLGHRAGPTRWSAIKDSSRILLNKLVYHAETAADILKDEV
jgi:hypothetical protein